MRYTLKQLQTKTNDELDELAALACYNLGIKSDAITNTVTSNPYSKNYYHPTQDDAQAFKLMVEGKLEVDLSTSNPWVYTESAGFEHSDPRIAIVVMFIFSKQT